MFDGMFQHSYEAETCYIPWGNYLISLWIQLLLYSTRAQTCAGFKTDQSWVKS